MNLLNKELQKALAAKTEFLNNISHEVRTPIQGFTSISQGLVEHWNSFDDSKKFKFVTQVASSAKRLGSLMNNLLDLSKFTADKMFMDFKSMDLNLSIEEVIEECKTLYLNTKSIEIIFHQCKDANLVGDKERIGQVLRNIFANAIKFSSDKGKIIASLTSSNDSLHFSISDEGVGIPPTELKEIFDPFTQSSRTKTRAGGTGLGLSIAKEIIDAHHGKIWAENNIEGGSCFHFIIPKKI